MFEKQTIHQSAEKPFNLNERVSEWREKLKKNPNIDVLGRNFCAAKTCETWLNEAKSSNQQAALAELATDSWKVAFQSATELGEQGYQLWRNLEGIATEMSDSKVSMAEFWAQVTQPKSDTQV